MKSDNDPTKLWMTPGFDGDIRLDKGRTQKLLTVDVHSLVRNKSATVHCSRATRKKRKWSGRPDSNRQPMDISRQRPKLLPATVHCSARLSYVPLFRASPAWF